MITTALWTRRVALLLLAAAIGVTMFLTVGAAPASAKDGRQTLIYDQFTLGKGESGEMNGREPDSASIGTLWVEELGDWYVVGRKGGRVVERSPEDWSVASDKRVNIDAQTADVVVSSEIKRGDGYQYFGVTARHTGPVDWLGAWFDPEGWPADVGAGQTCPGGESRCGAIVLGAKENPEPGVVIWSELRRARYDWPKGKTHKISLEVNGDEVRVLVGKKVMIEAQFSGLGDATGVGLFSRGAGEAEFKDFKASGSDPLEGAMGHGKKKPKKPKG